MDIECSEQFDKQNSGLKPKTCDVYDAQYCIKTTGIFEGDRGTQRFCSSRDMGNYCEYVGRKGDDREYRSCIYTCSSNECNFSFRIKAFHCLLLFIVILNFYIIF
ncbi:uncharacterized protein B4U79_00290 [Dinothrombium tinctorium]|uniref:Protein quiver n=1 Tax=Dinothrombium tinctorium TaxID=1965070 RepID=A0A3S3PH05_9ACAR|nr:uncharacterized protein B4U79_12032 [Dinothrombium tinctorium]RWS09499.1 uncharacterized protein B4U79_05568 [Dinothrombium tinctorium]RWS09526.1 uncharacterized protein B4U79_13631 [Dinothrombium tinctorium]RWS09794.1 uncharacterized protein B4U79_00290 [Dinothrombium tinctorium]